MRQQARGMDKMYSNASPCGELGDWLPAWRARKKCLSVLAHPEPTTLSLRHATGFITILHAYKTYTLLKASKSEKRKAFDTDHPSFKPRAFGSMLAFWAVHFHAIWKCRFQKWWQRVVCMCFSAFLCRSARFLDLMICRPLNPSSPLLSHFESPKNLLHGLPPTNRRMKLSSWIWRGNMHFGLDGTILVASFLVKSLCLRSQIF